MDYEMTIKGLTLDQAKMIYAEAIGVSHREVFGHEGQAWGPARHRYIGNSSVEIKPVKVGEMPRRPHPVPFCLVRSLDTAEIRTFGGYVGQGRFIAVDAHAGQSDEELVADWEPIDGHGGTVDWPGEG